MARTTISEVVEGIRRELNSINRYEVSTLAANVDADDTVLTLTYDLPPSLRAGAVLTIGWETMRVMAIETAPKEVTVIRGWEGSTAAAHTALDEVWINPRFTATKISEALHDECIGLPESLYRVATYQAPVTMGLDTIELPEEWVTMYGLIDARGRLTDPVTSSAQQRTVWPRIEGRIYRSDPDVWTEGPTTGVYFRPKRRLSYYTGTANVGHILFTAALPFDLTTFDSTQDLITDFGMQASMLDIVKMGVKMRLMPDEEIGRSDRRGQDDNRRAEEVPSGAALRPMQALYNVYLRRRQEETNRLRALYPIWIS